MSDPRPFLDRPAARLVAVLVAVLALSLLGWIHRDDLLPQPPGVAGPADAAFLACFEPRAAQIARSLADRELREDQARLFTARAEAFCRDTAGGGNNAIPSLPGQ